MRKTILIAILLSIAPVAASAAETSVVTAAHMIDVIAGKTVDKPQVTIVDGRISAVGKQGDRVPDGAKRIDLGDRTLLPGLIDMHVHLTADPR
ncbi:MAG TPA: amidohydrolase family protein, partial [Nevskiaceae bacterium]|nr:amidohydrolase family protein [Nevskiaceae bacterium]